MKNEYFEVRASNIEGTGCFAKQRIAKGTRIAEYKGEHITPAIALERYGREDECEDTGEPVPHVYLFTVSKRLIIDGGVNGSDARFINHSCDPNCETVVEGKHVYIESLRKIKEGEELTFDYALDIGGEITKEDKKRYACLCGSENCRGTMLELPEKKKSKKSKDKAKEKAKEKAKAKAKEKSKKKSKELKKAA